LIVDEHAKAVLAWHIRLGDDGLDTIHRLRDRGIDGKNARVSMRRTQDLHMQHARHCHVAGVFEAP
jgi:hypothetical protein